MWVRWPVVVAVLAVCAGGILPVSAAVKPVVTNKSRFRIPFRFDAAALQRMNARELHLYVSPNRGTSWELAQKISAQSGKFEFQAPADGEYWFAVRTIDGFGAAHPPGNRLDAGLIVVVDSIAPTLAINLEQVAAGKIQLTWSASDGNLDATSLRLEYQQPGNSGWQPVGVVPTQRGNTTWSVPAAGRVAVRGSVSDLAGNIGQTSAEIDAAAARVPHDPAKPDLRQPIANEPSRDQLSEVDPSANSPQMTIQPRTASVTPRANGMTPETMPQGLTPPVPSVVGPSVGTPLVSSPQDRVPSVLQERWSPAPTEGDVPGYRSAARQRVVNTRKFQLGYRVDDVGPSGVGSVELFITTDNGRQWYRYGEDADRKSPFDVLVPRDGEYGFSIRVRSGAGLAQDPPLPSEPPAIVVVVDQTPPRVELLPVRQGAGQELNQVTIEWRVVEERPADKSISLYYAANPQGPWELISGWRPDTGNFTWTVGPGNPSQFYVRVMARDAAGNVTQTDTIQPILVDLTRPSARIVDVEIDGAVPR